MSTVSLAEAAAPERALIEVAVRSGNGDPSEVEMPAPQTSDSKIWLEGDGSSVVRMVEETAAVWRDGFAACEAVPSRLDALGSPDEMLSAATATPDPVTAEVLVTLHSAIGRQLSACADQATYDELIPGFAWQWALADRRLQELGVL